MSELVCDKSFSDYFFNGDLENEYRTIAILTNKKISVRGRYYLEIVGRDIQTCRIVKLVDYYGIDRELCSFSSEMSSYQKSSVIKAPCKYICLPDSANVLQIVGKPQRLGKTNFSKLREKYNSLLSSCTVDYLTRQSDINDLFEISGKKSFYVQVVIKSTIKKQYRKDGSKKYQFKIENSFADIDFRCNSFCPEKHEDEFYSGFGLLRIHNLNNRPVCKVIDLQLPGMFFKNEAEHYNIQYWENEHYYEMLAENQYFYDNDEYDYDYYDYDESVFKHGIGYADWDERDDQAWLEALQYRQDI